MKLLKIINNTEKIPVPNNSAQIKYWTREAARAVVIDDKNKIALLWVTKKNYYKLPGGGIEEGEDNLSALKRETLEEVGCNVEVLDEIGQIDEYRDQLSMLQKNYCYIAKVIGKKGAPDYTETEIDEGFELIWVDIDSALELVKNSRTQDEAGNFIIFRDEIFLARAKEMLEKVAK